MNLARIQKLQDKVKKENLDAFVITGLSDLTYLTGLRMEGYWVVVGRKSHWVITNRLLDGAFRQMGVTDGHMLVKMNFKQLLEDLARQQSWHALAFDGEATPYSLGSYFEQQGFKNCPNFMSNLRAVKDKAEIDKIRSACRITAQAMRFIEKKLKPGAREKDLAYLIEDFMRKSGAERTSFDLIVGSGPNSAVPHHRTGERKVAAGDAVVVDIGCVYGNYCSDMTRTFYVGKKKDEFFNKIYSIVAASQKNGVATVRSGLAGKDIDKACRDLIEKEGYGQEFTHGTGHGVGLDIHEAPWIRAVSDNVLHPGMIVTVEPGIYLDGRFGVRIEDTVLVKENGAEVLTKA